MENLSPKIVRIYRLHALAIDKYWYNSVQFELAALLLSPGLGLAV